MKPPLIAGGQGRDAKDVTGDASLILTLAALFLILFAFCFCTDTGTTQ